MSAIFPAPQGSPLTMSSREIADLVEKRHDHVKRTIDMLSERGVIACPQIVEMQETGGNARTYTTRVYRLEKRDTFVVVAQLSPEFTARVVDRWEELEKIVSDPVVLLERAFADPKQARALLLQQVEKTVELEGRVEEMKPQVEALHRIAVSDGSMCITDAAKYLQLRRLQDLFAYMRANGWIYRRTGSKHDVAYQIRIQQGLLEHKVTTVHRSDGSEKSTEQVRVTPKGLVKLAEIFSPPNDQAEAA